MVRWLWATHNAPRLNERLPSRKREIFLNVPCVGDGPRGDGRRKSVRALACFFKGKAVARGLLSIGHRSVLFRAWRRTLGEGWKDALGGRTRGELQTTPGRSFVVPPAADGCSSLPRLLSIVLIVAPRAWPGNRSDLTKETSQGRPLQQTQVNSTDHRCVDCSVAPCRPSSLSETAISTSYSTIIVSPTEAQEQADQTQPRRGSTGGGLERSC